MNDQPTSRQAQLLDLLCEGYTSKQAADLMGISRQAASQIQRRAMESLQGKTVVHACIMWSEARKARPRLNLQPSGRQRAMRKKRPE